MQLHSQSLRWQRWRSRSYYNNTIKDHLVKSVQAENLSISLAPSLVQFIESYKTAKGCKSRSQVIEVALELLRQRELEESYREASVEVDPDWDVTVRDGLTDETW